MKILPFLLICLFFLSCSVQSSAVRPSKIEKKIEKTEDIITIIDTIAEILSEETEIYNNPQIIDSVEHRVRILLHKNQSARNFFISERVKIASKSQIINIASGPLRVLFIDENTVEISAFERSAKIALPCTLSLVSEKNRGKRSSVFSDGEKTYRGAVIFTGSKNGFSIINYIDVEDYLRGVVPLEIGTRPESDFEALKAQAVAARTYTLSRVSANFNKEFDLLATVADQVYGGANCEYNLSDSAIAKTRGIVLTKENGELVNAFYHATCGGMTAAVDEVWRSAPDASLISRSDLREDGTPFCNWVSSYSWQETWSINEFSEILRKFSRSSNEMPFDGIVRQVRVVSRTPSGRVAELLVISDKGEFRYGRDRARFVLRRPKDNGILRSSRFDIAIQKTHISATGFGHGHGIGMCQNGAIRRAKENQNFKQILTAYYTGIEFSQWNEVLLKIKE